MAVRAERVYDKINENPRPTMLGRVKNSLSLGLVAGLLSALFLILETLMLLFWEWLSPEDSIEKAVDFDYQRYMTDKESFGDHTFKVSTSKSAPNSQVTQTKWYSSYTTQEGKRRFKINEYKAPPV